MDDETTINLLEAMNHSNNGVRLVELGRHAEARKFLQSSIDLIDRYLSGDEAFQSEHHDITDFFMWSEPFNLASDKAIHAFIYRAAVVFNEPRDLTLPLPRNWIRPISIAITFNMALHLHIVGLWKLSAQDAERAIALYTVALRGCSDNTNPMLRVVIMNNLGVLHYTEFVDYASARSCFVQLWDYLLLLQGGGRYERYILPEIRNHLNMNMVLLVPPSAAAGA